MLNELEGLCRSRLATEAKSALSFLREKNPQIRYVTSKGAPLPNFAACTMNEENDDQVMTSSIILAPTGRPLVLIVLRLPQLFRAVEGGTQL